MVFIGLFLAATSSSRNSYYPLIVVLLLVDHDDVASNYKLLKLGQFSSEFNETCFKLKNNLLPFFPRNYFPTFYFF